VIPSLREIARALGGVLVGDQVLAPGPSHGPRDRSLCVKLSATAPFGFVVHSFAGDDFQLCRDYVVGSLGIDRSMPRRGQGAPRPAAEAPGQGNDRAVKISTAIAVWGASVDPRDTPAERYLISRGLELEEDIAGAVLRWNPKVGAMVGLFHNIASGTPQAVSRTFLDRAGRKLDRKFLGPTGDAAMKLDPDEQVTHGLHIGEGVETCMAARQLGLRPTWALGSSSALAAFTVLAGIECLTLLAEHDDASARAIKQCGDRWHEAGREVLINEPVGGKDLNDALRRRTSQ
jgi:putative DNA primase/helicase